MTKETLTVNTDEEGATMYRNADGEIHNANGPAVVCASGYKAYYINDELHNPDGPAIVCADGGKAYYINSKELTEAEFTAWQAEQTAK